MERRYLNINELSEYLGIPKGTLYVWKNQRRIPFRKMSNLVKFDKQEIDIEIKAGTFPKSLDSCFNDVTMVNDNGNN